LNRDSPSHTSRHHLTEAPAEDSKTEHWGVGHI
jgi:hypothetical protein